MNYALDAIWWRLRHPAVRDLAALLTAPPLWHSGCELPIPRLLGSQGFRFLLGLDDAPAPLTQWLEQEAPFGHRLGHYAESLLAFWLTHAPHCQLIARNHPIRSESGQTLGAADFLCLLDSAPYHLELTCKYYGGTTPDDFQGLNPADTLLGKAAKLQQQCRLFHTPQARAQLPAPLQGYLKTSAASFCEAKTSEASFCEAKTSEASFAKTSEASFREAKTSPETRSREIKIAMLYLAGAVLSALPSFFSGAWLWMLWVSVSLLVVAFAYLTGNAAVFQKQADGRLSAAATVLLLPYLAGVRLNMVYWLRGKAKTARVRDDVLIGSVSAISDGLPAVLDVCAEYPRPRYRGTYRVLPLLDMVAPSENDLMQAASLLETLRRQRGKVLTCCALGYGRSAAVVLTWLLVYGGCRDLAQATAELKQARPQMVLPPETAKAVEAAAGYLKKQAHNQPDIDARYPG